MFRAWQSARGNPPQAQVAELVIMLIGAREMSDGLFEKLNAALNLEGHFRQAREVLCEHSSLRQDLDRVRAQGGNVTVTVQVTEAPDTREESLTSPSEKASVWISVSVNINGKLYGNNLFINP